LSADANAAVESTTAAAEEAKAKADSADKDKKEA
jgi:hypothetical protein